MNEINQVSWKIHRGGWGYVLKNLSALESTDGLLFDGWIDVTFGYQREAFVKNQIIPYRENWIGFIHHPVTIAPWFYDKLFDPAFVVDSPEFRASLSRCKGIFTLSNHLREFVVSKIPSGIKIFSIPHPGEFVDRTFDFNAYVEEPTVVHVGIWMRKFTSFIKLRSPSVKKVCLINDAIVDYMKREIEYYGPVGQTALDSILFVKRVDDNVYDQLLTQTVVFLDLYDSSANNTIVECIVRNTPLLINRINPVVEYLGGEYPFYYGSLEEASEKLQNHKLIYDTHRYLATLDKRKFTIEYFVDTFRSCIEEIDQS